MFDSITTKIAPYTHDGLVYVNSIVHWLSTHLASLKMMVIQTLMQGGMYAGAFLCVAVLAFIYAIYKIVQSMDNSDNNDGIIAIVFIMSLIGAGIAFAIFGNGSVVNGSI